MPGHRNAHGDEARVNYVEFHLGDWAQATAHLTMLEEGVYLRLVRWYYAEEKPLPLQERAIFRIARAASEAEREAVRQVLADFFELRDDGYHQARCDEELDRYRRKREKAQGSARARWAHADSMPPHTTAPAVAPKTDATASATAPPEPANASKPDAKAMLSRLQTPDSSHQTAPSVLSRARDERPDDPERWARIREAYPPFPGRQTWIQAQHAAACRIGEGVSWDQLEAGTKRFGAFIRATGQIAMGPHTFFGAADKPWSQPWELPKPTLGPGRGAPPPVPPKTPEQLAEDERLGKLARETAERFRVGGPR